MQYLEYREDKEKNGLNKKVSNIKYICIHMPSLNFNTNMSFNLSSIAENIFQSLAKNPEERATRNREQGDWTAFMANGGSPFHVTEGILKFPMFVQIKTWTKPFIDDYFTKCQMRSYECHTMKYRPLCIEAVATYHWLSNGFGNNYNGN